MTISAELQERYTSEADVDWRAALILSHPEATTKYLINHTEEYQGYDHQGVLRTFVPVPMEVVFPNRDDSGRSDMSLVICGVQDEALDFLFDALDDGTKPVTCRYSIFILGDQTPQLDPWMEFQLTGISVTDDAVAATASRSNVINVMFPTQVYRLSEFPGLRRR